MILAIKKRKVRKKTIEAPEGISSIYAANKPERDPKTLNITERGITFRKLRVKSMAVICGMVNKLSTNIMPTALIVITIEIAIRTDIVYLKKPDFIPMMEANSGSKALLMSGRKNKTKNTVTKTVKIIK